MGTVQAMSPIAAKDRSAVAFVFQRHVASDQKRRYERWLASSSTSTPDGPEMRIAWQLAQILGENPNRVIRSLRRQRGPDERFIERLERIVRQNPSIRFVQDGRVRRVGFAVRQPGAIE